MHRSSFRAKNAPNPEKFKQVVDATANKVLGERIASLEQKIKEELDGLDVRISSLGRTLDGFIGDLEVQISERLDKLDSAIGFTGAAITSSTGKAIIKYTEPVAYGLRTIRQAVADIKIPEARDHSSELELLNNRFSLLEAKLETDLATAGRKIASSLDKLAKVKPPVHGNDDLFADAFMNINKKLDSLSSVARQDEPSDVSDAVSLMQAYIKMPKKILRDRDGNISGWELGKGKLN